MRRHFGIGATVLLVAAGMMTLLLGPRPAATGARGDGTPTPSPYAGQESSSVPGLTETEISQLRAGMGMGLARPAEINGYPGPRHVLDLADELALSDEQRTAVQTLFDQMKAEAVPLGEQFLDRYAALERAFRDSSITLETLEQQTAEIGRNEGELRALHLRYHLPTRSLLTDAQVAAYSRLRGYTDPSRPPHHSPGGHGGTGH